MTTVPSEGAGGGDTAAPSTDGPQTLAAVTRGLWDLAQQRGYVWVPPSPLALPEGILHPAVFEHLLGANPDSLAFFQTVLRPFDGRAADHPTRAAIYQQGVFVLRSDPAEAARVALATLESVSLDPSAHDLQFSDRLWESRALDAQGAGWQLEVDGLGVVRICALQRFVGRELEPATQVVTVGVERLAMVLGSGSGAGASQGSPSLRSWPGDATLAEVSSWSQTMAPAEWLEQAVENDARGARHALGAGLPRVAYEQAVSSLVRLDQLSLHGLLPLKAREERLEEIRRRVGEIADALVAELAGAIEETPVDEALAEDVETVAEEIAEPDAPTTEEGVAVAEAKDSEPPTRETSPDPGDAVDPDSAEPEPAEPEPTEPKPTETESTESETAEAESPEPSETESGSKRRPRRRSSTGRRKTKKGRESRRSKSDGADAEEPSS